MKYKLLHKTITNSTIIELCINHTGNYCVSVCFFSGNSIGSSVSSEYSNIKNNKKLAINSYIECLHKYSEKDCIDFMRTIKWSQINQK